MANGSDLIVRAVFFVLNRQRWRLSLEGAFGSGQRFAELNGLRFLALCA